MEIETTTTTEAPETTDGFLSGLEDETPETEVPENQPETEETGAAEQETPPAGEATVVEAPPAAETPAEDGAAAGGGEQVHQSETPKTWALRHMDEVRNVGEAEMVTLAQKGMDYDRIRVKYEESKPVMELFGQFAKQANMSVQDYVSYIRTQAKQASGMSEAEARRAVALEDREANVAAKEAADAEQQAAAQRAAAVQNSEVARRQADILEFRKTFPDAAKDPQAIPAEVWADVRGGLSLVAAYSKYAVAQAKNAQQTAEQKAAAGAQNQKNAARATGSMRSAGESTATKDPFLEGWDS